MEHTGDGVNHFSNVGGAAGDELGGALSLADTLEEDRERHQDVIRALDVFDEEHGTELTASAEEVRELESGTASA